MEIEIEQSLYIDGEEVESRRVRVKHTDDTDLLEQRIAAAAITLPTFRVAIDQYKSSQERPPF